TMATSYPSGNRRISRVSVMASFNLSRPSAERCDRPTRALPSAFGRQPGRFAHGPDEKNGLSGLVSGFKDLGIGGLLARPRSKEKGGRERPPFGTKATPGCALSNRT